MIGISNIKLSPSGALRYDKNPKLFKKIACRMLSVRDSDIASVHIKKRSVDARRKNDIKILYTVAVKLNIDENAVVSQNKKDAIIMRESAPIVYGPVSTPSTPPVVIGGGPAGLFAALSLAKAGLEPVLLEGGKSVDERIQDVVAFRKSGILNPESNIQFGEGGAGTFSDGKLNSGIKSPFCAEVLREFVKNGAPEQILWSTKPHLGTDNLVDIVKNMRCEITSFGGKVLFSHKVVDIEIVDGKVAGVVAENGGERRFFETNRVVIAIGHSARDTFEMLHKKGVAMEQKPFAIGLRIEHRRADIDAAQYGRLAGHEALGAADYKLATNVKTGRGVYSFCMCPGGEVVASSSEAGGLVVNGMSKFARDAVNSNSAIVVNVTPDDFMLTDDAPAYNAPAYNAANPLAGVEFQRKYERTAYNLGASGGKFYAPIQTVADFLKKQKTVSLGAVSPSYTPGVTLANLWDCLPPYVGESIALAMPVFSNKIRAFGKGDAIFTGIETRTSSPVRILRDRETASSNITGLFPCGEGAGYAGGIMSAAVDGMLCAKKLFDSLTLSV